MSDFKFACPVCGQHITADSNASGTQLECPTCFQKIVVPQAPASGEAKFILAASQAAKPRPTPAAVASDLEPIQLAAGRKFIPGIVAALAVAVICAAGAAAFFWRDKLFSHADAAQPEAEIMATQQVAAAAAPSVQPAPANTNWTLDLTSAVIPEAPAAGNIHGSSFLCQRATLRGGELTLRQGRGWPPDLGVTVHLVAREGEELSAQTVEIAPDRPSPAPKVTLRWKDAQQQAVNKNFAAGYALKIVFGRSANERMPGKIYLSLPDEAKSFVAGTFIAEIRRPSSPKQHPPKRP